MEQSTPARKKELEIHVSGIRAFMKCRQYWHFTDFNRLNRTVRDENSQSFFLRGSACHVWWEHYYANNAHDEDAAWTAYAKYWREEAPAYERTKLHLDTTLMLQHYVDSLRTREKTKELPDSELTFKATEQKFRLPVTHPLTHKKLDGAFYAGTFDGLVEYKGGIYVWENKTSAFPEKLLRSIDTHDNQSKLYVLAARALFPNVKGIIYNVMRSAVPEAPEKLKSGAWSQNKKWNGSYTYFRSLFDGPIPPEYIDFVNHTVGNEGSWFQRKVIIPDSSVSIEILLEMYNICKEMMRKDIPIWKARDSFVCDKCPFYPVCYEKASLDSISMIRGSHNEW